MFLPARTSDTHSLQAKRKLVAKFEPAPYTVTDEESRECTCALLERQKKRKRAAPAARVSRAEVEKGLVATLKLFQAAGAHTGREPLHKYQDKSYFIPGCERINERPDERGLLRLGFSFLDDVAEPRATRSGGALYLLRCALLEKKLHEGFRMHYSRFALLLPLFGIFIVSDVEEVPSTAFISPNTPSHCFRKG